MTRDEFKQSVIMEALRRGEDPTEVVARALKALDIERTENEIE